MDHFTEVTQDVAEVSVKTSTSDVNGLTILDFKIAMLIDQYAEKNKIQQSQDTGNFTTNEGYGRYYCSTDKKWKTRQGPKQTRTTEAANAAQQAAIAVNMKKNHKKPKSDDLDEAVDRAAKSMMEDGYEFREEWSQQYKRTESMTLDEQFDMIEDMVESLALARGIDAEQIWEDLESFDDNILLSESAAWHRKAGKSKTGGLNAKGVASYRREHPGSKLQTAVTTKPSKLKPGSKAAKRRKSFCARMSGVKGPMKKPNGKPTRKALALRKWNC
jgi:hypothetical protein